MVFYATGNIQSPQAFLSAIGRKAKEQVTETDWDKFWKMGSVELRGAELPVRDRRSVPTLYESLSKPY
jgi:hypothetical protein